MARLPIRYDPAAVEELEKAADWYRARDPRVAQRFLRLVQKKLADIQAHPNLRPLDEFGTRQVLVGQFPYIIVYSIHHESVIILVAIAHTSRNPGYWASRLP